MVYQVTTKEASVTDRASKFSFRALIDVLAVVAPIVCIIHCLAVPIVLACLPMVRHSGVLQGFDDKLLAVLMLGLCAVAIAPGFAKHRRKSVLVLMVVGFALVWLSSYVETAWGEVPHLVISILGSVFVIKANLDNRRFLGAQAAPTCCGGHETT